MNSRDQSLVGYLLAWRRATDYGKDTDWVFASDKNKGKSPRVGNMLVRDYPYPAAIKAEVLTETLKLLKRMDKKTGTEIEVEKAIYFDKKGNRANGSGSTSSVTACPAFSRPRKSWTPRRLRWRYARATWRSRSISTRKPTTRN